MKEQKGGSGNQGGEVLGKNEGRKLVGKRARKLLFCIKKKRYFS